jgi:hypothetical protein
LAELNEVPIETVDDNEPVALLEFDLEAQNMNVMTVNDSEKADQIIGSWMSHTNLNNWQD